MGCSKSSDQKEITTRKWERLGPGAWALCCSAFTWTNILSNKILLVFCIDVNYQSLKITACMHSWDKLWTRQKNKTKPQLPLLKSQEQNQGVRSKSNGLCMPAALNTSGWANHLSQPSGLTPDTLLLLPHLRNQLTLTQGASKQGNLLLVFIPSCCSRSPNKPLPAFLIWPLINFCWWGEARNPGW